MSDILTIIVPIFAVVLLGAAVRRLGFVDDTFFGVSDRLLYFIFFPMLLFWKIGSPVNGAFPDYAMIAAVLIAIGIAFLASILFARVSGMPDRFVGSFSQACYRFNSYVGLAVVMAALGESGIRAFGVLIGFAIPLINLFSVTVLIWFSNREYSFAENARLLVRSLITNPLIIACFAGMLYSRVGPPFPSVVEGTFRLASGLTLPLALLSVGGALSLERAGRSYGWAAAATVIKLIVLPVIGYVLLTILNVTGLPFQIAMIYFALPTSPAIYILSARLNSDLDLAAGSIVMSVAASLFSLSIVLSMVLK
jgi:hypothetical protein